MQLTEIEMDILTYIIEFREGIEKHLPPSIVSLEVHFEEVYELNEIRKSISRLVSSGALRRHSFHSYLDLTETFKTRDSYITLRNKICGEQKNGNESK
jgi:hypothetical protein